MRLAPFRFRRAPARLLYALAAAWLLASCSDPVLESAPGAREGVAQMVVSAQVDAVGPVAIVARVTAADIPEPLVFQFPVAGGVVSGSIAVPAGSARRVEMTAVDAGGRATHRGTATVDMRAGDNPTLTIPLTPLVGSQEISVTLGSVVVRVRPGQLILGPGDTVRMTASVQNASGADVRARVQWYTLDPRVATIDSTGLLRARDTGSVRIVAGAAGVAQHSLVVVRPRTTATENRAPGTRDWLVPPDKRADQASLAMWASPYSVMVGDSVSIYIHSLTGPITLALYRLGWYGGSGGRLIWKKSGVAAGPQPACSPGTAPPVVCPWAVTVRGEIPGTSVSGIFLLNATDVTGKTTSYPLVVRDGRAAAFTAVVPVFTWQAYNRFGGQSLYTENRNFVSFERPYATTGAGGAVGVGGSNENSVVRYLERNGFDVTYVTNRELSDASPAPLAPTKALLFLGHDEYWTWEMYDRVERARDAGTHLFFFAANVAYWNVRLSASTASGRPASVITCYKSMGDPGATTPHTVTTTFRNLGRPENALLGVMYFAATQSFVVNSLVVADSAVGPDARRFLQSAGLSAGDSIPRTNGTEGDQIVENGKTPANLQVLFKSPIIPLTATSSPAWFYTTFYVAPSGAGVFAAGNVEFGRGLDDLYGYGQPRLQTVTTSVLNWMLAH